MVDVRGTQVADGDKTEGYVAVFHGVLVPDPALQLAAGRLVELCVDSVYRFEQTGVPGPSQVSQGQRDSAG